MASTYLTRTPSSNGNRKTWTFSAWCKVQGNSDETIFDVGTNGSNNYTPIFFQSNGTIRLYEVVGGTLQSYNLITNRVFRDRNAWYHLVYRVDTTQSTASDRIRLYVNGVQETSFSTASYPAQNYDTLKNSTSYANVLGVAADNYGANLYDGLMSHVHFCDGYSYAPTEFGETDSTTGEWKINTSPSVTYGTNGFFILKDGNSVTDQSGNGNNFTVGGGTLTKTEDNPSNVFATLNPLCNGSNTTLSTGNTVTTGNTSSDSGMSTVTLPVASSGKYYWEMKIAGSHGDYPKAGIFKNWEAIAQGTMNGASGGAFQLDAYIQKGSTTLFSDDGNITITAPANDNIIMYALDSVNGKFYIGNNGVWYNSGDPTSGSTGTGSVLNLTSGNINMIATHEYNGSSSNWNFGNGYFGTTAVSSAGTNASNNGIFEYDVPTGYTALSTNGLNL